MSVWRRRPIFVSSVSASGKLSRGKRVPNVRMRMMSSSESMRSFCRRNVSRRLSLWVKSIALAHSSQSFPVMSSVKLSSSHLTASQARVRAAPRPAWCKNRSRMAAPNRSASRKAGAAMKTPSNSMMVEMAMTGA